MCAGESYGGEKGRFIALGFRDTILVLSNMCIPPDWSSACVFPFLSFPFLFFPFLSFFLFSFLSFPLLSFLFFLFFRQSKTQPAVYFRLIHPTQRRKTPLPPFPLTSFRSVVTCGLAPFSSVASTFFLCSFFFPKFSALYIPITLGN